MTSVQQDGEPVGKAESRPVAGIAWEATVRPPPPLPRPLRAPPRARGCAAR
jgi:hypothetical protein